MPHSGTNVTDIIFARGRFIHTTDEVFGETSSGEVYLLMFPSVSRIISNDFHRSTVEC